MRVLRLRARSAPIRFASLVLAAALLAVLPPGVAADTNSELRAARARAAALERRMAAQEAAVSAWRGRLAAAGARLAEARAALAATRGRIAETRASIAASTRRLRGLRARLNRRAAAAYVSGPGSPVEMLLAASSLSDFHARLEFAGRVVGRDATLVLGVRRHGTALLRAKQRLARLASEQAGRLETIERQHRELQDAAAAQRRALSGLVASRLEAIALAEQLEKRLRAERRATVHRGPITFGAWASHFLPRLGAPDCHENMVLVVAWEVAEYTAARWNPLATTYDMPGATDFNGGGVKNYVSLDQGLEASRLTLGLPDRGYEPIVARLRSCADAMETADAIDRSAWCSCGDTGYVRRFVPPVRRDYARFANTKPPWS